MSKLFVFDCFFTTKNLLTGHRYRVSKRVRSTSISKVKKTLRLSGYTIGNDFCYWKHEENLF